MSTYNVCCAYLSPAGPRASPGRPGSCPAALGTPLPRSSPRRWPVAAPRRPATAPPAASDAVPPGPGSPGSDDAAGTVPLPATAPGSRSYREQMRLLKIIFNQRFSGDDNS